MPNGERIVSGFPTIQLINIVGSPPLRRKTLGTGETYPMSEPMQEASGGRSAMVVPTATEVGSLT
jgi:hypothetical protein